MSDQHFTETHHTDKTGKRVAWIIVVVVFIAAAIALSWNESNNIEKKIAKSQAVADSLSHEMEWRLEIIAHHDSLEKITADEAAFRKLPFKKRQEINSELDTTTPKIRSTKHNAEVFEKLLAIEQEKLDKLRNNPIYSIYH